MYRKSGAERTEELLSEAGGVQQEKRGSVNEQLEKAQGDVGDTESLAASLSGGSKGDAEGLFAGLLKGKKPGEEAFKSPAGFGAKFSQNGKYWFFNPNFVGFFGLVGAVEPYVYILAAIVCTIGVAAGVESENTPRPLCIIWILFGALAMYSTMSGRSKSENIHARHTNMKEVTRLLEDHLAK